MWQLWISWVSMQAGDPKWRLRRVTGLEQPVAEHVWLWMGAVLLVIASKINFPIWFGHFKLSEICASNLSYVWVPFSCQWKSGDTSCLNVARWNYMCWISHLDCYRTECDFMYFRPSQAPHEWNAPSCIALLLQWRWSKDHFLKRK